MSRAAHWSHHITYTTELASHILRIHSAVILIPSTDLRYKEQWRTPPRRDTGCWKRKRYKPRTLRSLVASTAHISTER
eukprot:7499369-Pyramimonas_sp.AAC.1